ncbi:uncharacterized protein FFB14_04520 [Fusarium fujikuroi]|nr:uncharacterized protein FFB14_04520 [Fusarium fujikuroi]
MFGCPCHIPPGIGAWVFVSGLGHFLGKSVDDDEGIFVMFFNIMGDVVLPPLITQNDAIISNDTGHGLRIPRKGFAIRQFLSRGTGGRLCQKLVHGFEVS